MNKTILKEQLKQNRKEYKDNYELMVSSIGTKEHQHYIDREKILHRKQIQLMKALNIFMEDPCPVNCHTYCHSCTGFYYTAGYKSYKCEAGFPNSVECPLKASTHELIDFLEKSLSSR